MKDFAALTGAAPFVVATAAESGANRAAERYFPETRRPPVQ
jgi:hypothetical protein